MGDLQIVLAGGTIEAQHVEMKVPLYSYGCEKKIKKALSNLKGTHHVIGPFYGINRLSNGNVGAAMHEC